MTYITHLQFDDNYNEKDMEAAFIAGRLMFLEKVPFFDSFYDFYIWYKVTRNYEEVLQLQKKVSPDNVQEEHKGLSET